MMEYNSNIIECGCSSTEQDSVNDEMMDNDDDADSDADSGVLKNANDSPGIDT